MKLFFLYGPPAVGKLTVAKVLKQKTGYKLLHNHLLQNPITEVFSYDNPVNRLLVRGFRLRILEEASKNNIDIIATFGIAGNNPFSHIDDVIKTVESQGGEVCLVHLTADKEALLQRVGNASRKEQGKDLSKANLGELLLKNSDIFDKYPKREHLTVDTGIDNPEQVVEKILKFYTLK